MSQFDVTCKRCGCKIIQTYYDYNNNRVQYVCTSEYCHKGISKIKCDFNKKCAIYESYQSVMNDYSIFIDHINSETMIYKIDRGGRLVMIMGIIYPITIIVNLCGAKYIYFDYVKDNLHNLIKLGTLY